VEKLTSGSFPTGNMGCPTGDLAELQSPQILKSESRDHRREVGAHSLRHLVGIRFRIQFKMIFVTGRRCTLRCGGGPSELTSLFRIICLVFTIL